MTAAAIAVVPDGATAGGWGMARPFVGRSAQEPSGFDLASAWRDHGSAVLGYAFNRLGDRATAEDCVQETFLRAWRSRDRYDGSQASVRTWLFTIARNVVTDAARARARRPAPVTAETVTRLTPSVAGDQARVDDRRTLVTALARLTPEHREVLVAVTMDRMTYAELSERTGVPVATLRTRAYHALRALRPLVDEEENDA